MMLARRCQRTDMGENTSAPEQSEQLPEATQAEVEEAIAKIKEQKREQLIIVP